MKSIWVLSLALFFTSISGAFESGDFNVNSGFGAFGTRGLFGVSGDYFLTPHQAISGSLAVDFVGSGGSLGYKLFSAKGNDSGTFWDKCLFLFTCDSHYYGGVSVKYAANTTVTYSVDEVDERSYETGKKWLGLIVAGFRDQFTNRLTLDIEISYSHVLSRDSIKQTSGVENPEDIDDIESMLKGVGIGFALGYNF